jgi:NAD(P)-dependent dehydrogenase (short-subunit alcohol dehydrogenase family)
VEQLVAGVVSAHGRLDIALNIAGIGGATALPGEYPIDSWRDVVT